jgi:UPF0755 protein
MIDELDLAFDEHADRSKPRHRRGGRGAKKSSGKSAVAFLMAFILLALLGGGAYLGYTKVKGFFVAADYSGSGTDPIQVTIAQGSTLTDMGNTLVDDDVVKSTKAFTNAADKDPRGKNIQAGTYNLRKQMSAKSAVAALLDPKSRITSGVTIPEGKTALQTYALLSKATKIPVKDFQAAGKNPIALGVPTWWFNRRDHLPAQKSIEGFLFPDTYEFDPKLDATQILKTMVDRFMTQVQDLGFVDTVQNNLSVSPFEALVVASLAQAEAGNTVDLSKISRVAYNRAYHAKIPLQFDVTTNYWLELNGKAAKSSGQLSNAELNDPKNPYSTTKKVGLPVGPIDNPGKAALQGAMQPTPGSWLFFVVVDKSGRSAFATTNAQHNANKVLACRNGIKLPECP